MQRWAWVIWGAALVAIGVTALFPRDIYGRLYPLYARDWVYDPWPHVVVWVSLLAASGLLSWATARRERQVSLLRRGIAVCAAVALVCTAVLPPDYYSAPTFLLAPFLQISIEEWIIRVAIEMLLSVCWLAVIEKSTLWGRRQRGVMIAVTALMVVAPLWHNLPIDSISDVDFFDVSVFYLPPALLIVLLMGIADWAVQRRLSATPSVESD